MCYLAGAESKGVFAALVDSGSQHSLQSFVNHGSRFEKKIMITPEDFRFFLDSGAFSAWSKGTVIDIDEYCEFIRANIEHLDVYASLDVIPGTPGHIATPQEKDKAAGQSWENYLYMRAQGLFPLPVYHYGEDSKWLRNILDYGCDYVAIGGLVGVPGGRRRQWLDRVFTGLTKADGKPIVKTHGFGMTSIPLIFRYPWYSVDSMSWLMVGAVGNIYLPQTKGDEFLFDRTPNVISVSENSPQTKVDGKHFNTLGPTSRELVHKWLAFCNMTIEQVTEHYYWRDVCNATFFKMVAEKRVDSAFTDRLVTQKGFF